MGVAVPLTPPDSSLAARKLAWAFGQSPINIRKFVKRLPSLGLNPLGPNEDGLYVPVAQPLSRTIKPKKGLAYQVDYYKMQTFDQHLFVLVRDGIVTYEDACSVASRPQDLTVELRAAGVVH